jgi:hypothetical protein
MQLARPKSPRGSALNSPHTSPVEAELPPAWSLSEQPSNPQHQRTRSADPSASTPQPTSPQHRRVTSLQERGSVRHDVTRELLARLNTTDSGISSVSQSSSERSKKDRDLVSLILTENRNINLLIYFMLSVCFKRWKSLCYYSRWKNC